MFGQSTSTDSPWRFHRLRKRCAAPACHRARGEAPSCGWRRLQVGENSRFWILDAPLLHDRCVASLGSLVGGPLAEALGVGRKAQALSMECTSPRSAVLRGSSVPPPGTRTSAGMGSSAGFLK